MGTEPLLHSLFVVLCNSILFTSQAPRKKNSWGGEFLLHANLDIISGGSGWTPGLSGPGGTSSLYCHGTSLGEFNPPQRRGCESLDTY